MADGTERVNSVVSTKCPRVPAHLILFIQYKLILIITHLIPHLPLTSNPLSSNPQSSHLNSSEATISFWPNSSSWSNQSSSNPTHQIPTLLNRSEPNQHLLTLLNHLTIYSKLIPPSCFILTHVNPTLLNLNLTWSKSISTNLNPFLNSSDPTWLTQRPCNPNPSSPVHLIPTLLNRPSHLIHLSPIVYSELI